MMMTSLILRFLSLLSLVTIWASTRAETGQTGPNINNHTGYLNINWTNSLSPGLKVSKFLIEYFPPIGEPPSNTTLFGDWKWLTIDNAKANTQYDIVVKAQLANDETVTLLRETKNSTDRNAAAKILAFDAIVRSSSVKLVWKVSHHNLFSTDYRYRIRWKKKNEAVLNTTVIYDRYWAVFSGLEPNSAYIFSIAVISGFDQKGAERQIELLTMKHPSKLPWLISKNSNRLTIGFSEQFFPKQNGIPKEYMIIVTENYELDTFRYKYPSWRQVVGKKSPLPPYRTTSNDFNPFQNNQSFATYVVGDADVEDCAKIHLCNGPLKPQSAYFIKLKMCTLKNICMETDYAKFDLPYSRGPSETGSANRVNVDIDSSNTAASFKPLTCFQLLVTFLLLNF